MNLAWATFTITKADASGRTVEGVCSTPETDHAGDQVMPMGARWRAADRDGAIAPFLWQHDAQQPLGHIIALDAKPDGIRFRARIANISEPGRLKDRIDECYQAIREKLVRGVSIGFRPLVAEPIATGLRFLEWSLLEISAVTVPCNSSATISSVKAADRAARTSRHVIVRLSDPVGVKQAAPARVVRLDSPRVDPERPIASAIGKALDERDAARALLAAEKQLGVVPAMLVDMMATGTKATDAELAELRRRIAALEAKR